MQFCHLCCQMIDDDYDVEHFEVHAEADMRSALTSLSLYKDRPDTMRFIGKFLEKLYGGKVEITYYSDQELDQMAVQSLASHGGVNMQNMEAGQ